MKTAEKIEKYVKKNYGITIAVGSASNWIGSLQHAQNWADGGSIKRYCAFSEYSESYKAWIEPKNSYESMSQLFNQIKEGFVF